MGTHSTHRRHLRRIHSPWHHHRLAALVPPPVAQARGNTRIDGKSGGSLGRQHTSPALNQEQATGIPLRGRCTARRGTAKNHRRGNQRRRSGEERARRRGRGTGLAKERTWRRRRGRTQSTDSSSNSFSRGDPEARSSGGADSFPDSQARCTSRAETSNASSPTRSSETSRSDTRSRRSEADAKACTCADGSSANAIRRTCG